jgi:hypothetical protein
MIRTTCTQELRQLLGPEIGAPEGSLRRVQILPDPQGRIFVSLDAPTPDQIALSREQWMPPFFLGASPFQIGPSQVIYAAAKQGEGIVMCSIIVEYI